jgi:beta-galactosidase/beta-glucuronidase
MEIEMMERISLNGTWECKLPQDEIIHVTVPGCWDTDTPLKNIASEVSYAKTFQIAKSAEKKYFLYFGGVSYFCDVYVNGNKVGSHEGIWDHFRFEVTDSLRNGENRILLEIIKPGYDSQDRFPVREVLSGFIPDVICTFGGIWDDVFLEVYDSFLINSHFASGNRSGEGRITIAAEFFKACEFFISTEILSPEGETVKELRLKKTASVGQNTILLDFSLDHVMAWDLRHPNLYQYRVTVLCEGYQETVKKQFGFREVGYEGTKLLLNGSPVYARGILHWGFYDEIIIPNPSGSVIQDEIDKCMQLGFNMIKHCLYIPREEYFELADKNGILLWIEMPLWLPEGTQKLSERIRREYPRILEQIAGHPSVVFLTTVGCLKSCRYAHRIMWYIILCIF